MRSLARTRERRIGLFVGVFCTLVLSACAARVSLRVPAPAVASLPLERRLTLLDAESDLLAAQDARDSQEEQLLDAQEALHDAEGRIRKAEDALDKQKEGRDVAQAVLAEAQAREKYADQNVELQQAKLETAKAALLLAEARFELARAKEVDAAGESGKYAVKLAAYQEQVERISLVVQERTDAEVAVKAKAEELQKAWKSVSQQLAQMTGGSQGSVWVQ